MLLQNLRPSDCSVLHLFWFVDNLLLSIICGLISALCVFGSLQLLLRRLFIIVYLAIMPDLRNLSMIKFMFIFGALIGFACYHLINSILGGL